MQVKVLQTHGPAALVEWSDATGPHRGIVPAAAVVDGTDVDPIELAHAIPYGAPWEILYTPSVTALQVARLLRERGIWTEHDLARDVAGARAALAVAYGIDLKQLLDTARLAREGGTDGNLAQE